jgi:hypothetical protein
MDDHRVEDILVQNLRSEFGKLNGLEEAFVAAADAADGGRREDGSSLPPD